MTRQRTVAVATVILAVMLVAGEQADADPGDQETGSVWVSDMRRIDLGATPQVPQVIVVTQPQADRVDDLGGGIYATSSVGMQWGASGLGEDVQGRSASETNVTIDEINASGALVQHGDANAQNCYEGTIDWPINYTRYFTYIADTGWGPIYRGFHDCWVMSTSHYYVVTGARTDIYGPDYLRRF